MQNTNTWATFKLHEYYHRGLSPQRVIAFQCMLDPLEIRTEKILVRKGLRGCSSGARASAFSLVTRNEHGGDWTKTRGIKGKKREDGIFLLSFFLCSFFFFVSDDPSAARIAWRNRLEQDGPAGDLTKNKLCTHSNLLILFSFFFFFYSYLLVRVRQEWSN